MASFMKEFEHLEIKLEDIKSATNNFDEDKFIGKGGFGKVYKGELSHYEGKSMVAIKRLDRKYGQGDPEFLKEIRMLSCYKHENLISLLGFCKEGDEMILIYELATHGSLDRILHDVTLTWTQRLKICLDAAKGLSFLHDPNGTQQRILHRDIKSANILLDESLNAKVADFGLSKISPANQKYTFLFTSPVGTPGYCDPLYMDTYQLTKESDVYSFGVVLFEVLCGRVCYENRDRKLNILVPYWKKCYEQKKLDEIILPHLMSHMNPSSLEVFEDIAYQCLHKAREQRPTMSVIVEHLKIALNCQELLHFKPSEYEQIIQSADPPLIYKSNMELIQTLTKGVRVNDGKTMLSINEKGKICERIYIEACLNHIEDYQLVYPSEYENYRFPGGRCYIKNYWRLKVRVSAQFLCPRNTYSVNLVFRNAKREQCKTIHYKLDGETKCCMVYDTYEREDEWFVVPLYQFESDRKTADFIIDFEKCWNCTLLVAGFEFQPLEEKVGLHDQGLEEYQDIVQAASQSLFYKSLEELKELLSTGFHINNHKTWFSLNEKGEHCEMLSIEHCLITREGGYSFDHTELYSRFPQCYCTGKKGFEVHIRTQFLTPSIGYTVNLVLCKGEYSIKQTHVAIGYKLKGEAETSAVYHATKTQDGHSYIAELYQFTSDGRNFDLEIVFEDHEEDLQVEGILFQPQEKVEHEQVLEDEKLSNDIDSLQWTMKTMKRGVFSYVSKWFNGQKGYAVDKDGKKFLIFSARGAITSDKVSFKSSPESRFGEVAVITCYYNIEITKTIKPDVLPPETTYACYLIYKLPQDQSKFKRPLEIYDRWLRHLDHEDIYLVSPKTPVTGQNNHSPLNRPKPIYFPRQRKDGWMEVNVWQFQTESSTEHIQILLYLSPSYDYIRGLIIESIELRPIVAHSV